MLFDVIDLGVALWVAAILAGAWLVFRQPPPSLEEPPPRVFGPLTGPVGAVLPPSDRVRQQMVTAGYYHPYSLGNFLAVRTATTFLPIFAGLVVALGLPGVLSLYAAGAGLVGGVLGYALPGIWLATAASNRADRVRRGLPVLMENMSLALSAGLPLREAIAESGRTLARGFPDVAAEMRLVHRQAEFRSLGHALDQFRRRIPVPEVGSFAFLLIQADQTGSDAVKGLQELADSYRVSARQRAEEQANRNNFWMLIPTITCLFVATTIFMIAPQFLQLLKDGRRVLNELELSRQTLPTLIKPGSATPVMAPPPPAAPAPVNPEL